jgi:uncharacterized protein YqgV (UPF0045/DUF77 family)
MGSSTQTQDFCPTEGNAIMVVLEFSMFPLDKGESLSQYVARSLDVIDSSGLDQVMDVVSAVF